METINVPEKQKFQRTEIRLPAEVHEAVRRLAFEEKVSINQIIVAAVNMLLAELAKGGENEK